MPCHALPRRELQPFVSRGQEGNLCEARWFCLMAPHAEMAAFIQGAK
jgi:hypothetical protein